ncbi:MAG TPA: 8-amino-7-oxononanoate synthase [Candidatus Acidoferrales bacterium]|nr:8-amino-7-oxononanoate synthase [Candidatus Acidoferrales bacterium]
MSPSAINERMAQRLDSLRAQSQLRTLDTPAGINLNSNDYLGLATDPRLKQAVLDAVVQTTTVGSTGSRLLSGNSHEWEEAESEFADFAGTEAALYFGSGYAANLGLLTSILKPRDIVFSDARNHASLIDGIRLSGAAKVIYPHRDLSFLEDALRENSGVGGSKVIVSETVFSMEGDIAPITDLLRLARTYGAAVVLDEAHATGVLGPHGRGIAAQHACEGEILAIVHTCGKALASAGAFVCGGKTLKEYLVNCARTFIFSTAMPPYFARHIQAALALARQEDAARAHLREIASLLREDLAARGFDCGTSATHIVPVMLGSNEMALHVASEVQRCGFAVRAIRPPTVPVGSARVRFSLTSRLSLDDLRRLAQAMDAACKSLPIARAASAVHA